jgi:hypothetical protein
VRLRFCVSHVTASQKPIAGASPPKNNEICPQSIMPRAHIICIQPIGIDAPFLHHCLSFRLKSADDQVGTFRAATSPSVLAMRKKPEDADGGGEQAKQLAFGPQNSAVLSGSPSVFFCKNASRFYRVRCRA